MAAQRSVVLCSPLCFVISKLNKLSKVKIIDVVIDCFAADDITSAKRILVDDIRRLHLDKVDGRSLPQLRARRDADIATRLKKEIDDIIALLTSLDRHHIIGKLPIYAIDNTDSVPTLKLEDGDLQYVCAKFGKLEDAIFSVQTVINRLYALVNKTMNKALDQESTVMGGATGGTPVNLPGPGSSSSSNVNNICAPPSLLTTPSEHRTITTAMIDSLQSSVSSLQHNVFTQPGIVAGLTAATDVHDSYHSHSHSRWADCHVPTSSALDTDEGTTSRDNNNNDDDDNDFTVVESRRKKRRRKRNSPSPTRDHQQHQSRRQQQQRGTETTPALPAHHPLNNNSKKSYAIAVNTNKPLIVGKLRSPSDVTTPDRNTITGKLSAAKPLFGRAMFCVDNVSKEVSVSDVERFVKSRLGVRVIACNETKPRRSYRQIRDNVMPEHKAFYLCINKADTELLLDADKWPSDVSVSAWYFKKKTNDQQQIVVPAAATAAASISQPVATTFTVGAVIREQNLSVAIDKEAAVQPVTGAADAAAANTSSVGMNDTTGNTAAPEIMALSPIGANQSGEYLVPIGDNDNDTDLNSTSVAVVDLSTVIVNDR